MPTIPPGLGPWVLSGIAIVQVWVIALYKRLRRAKLDLFESHTVEVCYSGLGPQLSMVLTLKARHRDFFVRALRLKLIRKRDSSTHIFGWKFLRSFEFNPLKLKDPTAKASLVRSMVITPERPLSLYTVFTDDAFLKEVKGKVASLPTKWIEYRFRPGAEQPTDDLERDAMFWAFLQTPPATEVTNVLDRSFYWVAGDYEVQIELIDENERSKPLKTFFFEITSEQETVLRRNVHVIEREMCALAAEYNFIFPEYLPARALQSKT